ncbi:MAG: ankyrin repeat domain-containing protein [Nitrososphaerales archaeon]
MNDLTFKTENERLAHPIAKKILWPDWLYVYHQKLSETDLYLLSQPLGDCLKLLKKNDQDDNLTKLRHLISVMIGHKEITESAAKQILENLSLNNLLIDDIGALRHAAEKGHTAFVELLLQFPEVIKNIAANNNEVLCKALENDQTAFAERLLQVQAVGDNIAAGENRAFRKAAKYGHTRIVELLLQQFPAVVYNIAASNNGALRDAAEKGHTAIVEILLQFAAVRDNIAAEHNWAFIVAAKYGHTAIVKLLLKYPAVTDKIADNDNYVFCTAAEEDETYTAIVKLLLKYPAVFHHAEMHKQEFEKYVKPFTDDYLSALTREKQAFSTQAPNGVFELHDKDGHIDFNKTQFAYLVLRQLIRRHHPKLTEQQKLADNAAATLLLKIPSVLLLVKANATNRYPINFTWASGISKPQQNELIYLAQSVGCEWGSTLLLNIPEVKENVPINQPPLTFKL